MCLQVPGINNFQCIILPLNDSLSFDEPSTHWTLAVVLYSTSLYFAHLFHFDSMNRDVSTPSRAAVALQSKLAALLNMSVENFN